MVGHREKFQELLREMFQFDCSDLDFGIYRIMNFKREAVERFIQKDLLDAVNKELSTGSLASQSQVARERDDVADEIRETLGESALDGEGVLAEQFHGTPLGKRYLDLQSRASGAATRPALEAAIFNHLYAFFSRYYDAGDFLSKRRYSRKEKYAIPYNGEEVYLHWANSDQYYVKTGEYFTDYRYKAPNGVTVHFRLQQADVPQNNVKGDKRFFVPLAEGAHFDAKAKEVVVPFEFRPLKEAEQTKYGQRNQQDAIVTEVIETLPSRLKDHDVALAALIATYPQISDRTEVSLLAHHLRLYTQKNTSDFFVHKDLKGFLTRELDFYLKNEVLNLDDMQAAGEIRAEGWFQTMRVIKAVGGCIIGFLAQIEDFQKKLFEKKKFVTEAQYCITMGNIAEDFYRQIAACEAQWGEWKELFHIDEEEKNLFNSNARSRVDRRVMFLKGHPTLVLDTRHFDRDFRDRLLASFEDLDEMTDGLLIRSENFQALNLLADKLSSRLECIYIDPPYNTDASAILYKNDYKDSSWLSLVACRCSCARQLLTDDGIMCVAIDDVEFPYLRLLLKDLFGEANLLGVAAVRANPAGRSTPTGFSVAHDYAIFVRRSHDASVGRLQRSERQLARYDGKDKKGSFEWVNFRKHGGVGAARVARRRMYYPIYASEGNIRVPKMEWNEAQKEWDILEEPLSHEETVWPINAKDEQKRWKWGKEAVIKHISDFCSRPDQTGKTGIYFKSRMNDEGALPLTWWDKKEYSATEYGTNLLTDIFGRVGEFSFPKALHLVEDCLRASSLGENGTVLDFFGGSGTTAHAVIRLNIEDDGERKYILVEMGEYFDTVLLPRIKKITFSPEWKEGKPLRQATEEEAQRSPRIMKYVRLESYEDALTNIMFTDAPKTLYDLDDYMLRYMLDWETKESATFLNIEQLTRPFTYRLTMPEGQDVLEKPVDIPETFAYLLGMHVTTRQTYDDDDRYYLVYRGRIDHREIAVIWRETAGWEKADYERDKKFVAGQKLAQGADEVFVNGDSLIPHARTLDGVFKSRMFGGL